MLQQERVVVADEKLGEEVGHAHGHVGVLIPHGVIELHGKHLVRPAGAWAAAHTLHILQGCLGLLQTQA